jgi:hypothetical protein
MFATRNLLYSRKGFGSETCPVVSLCVMCECLRDAIVLHFLHLKRTEGMSDRQRPDLVGDAGHTASVPKVGNV